MANTIDITLTNDTWVSFTTSVQQAIINGLDSAGSETYGWDAEVKARIGTSQVARSSSTLCRITLLASEVANYRISSNETITATIPASALTTSSIAVVASGAFTITAATESAAVTGSLAGGITEQALRDSAGTIVLTLTNTEWASSLSDSVKQNIINGLVSAQSESTGWNAEVKARLVPGDVARTNDTTVTITATTTDVAAYRITANETITATIPHAALIYGADIVASGTLTVSSATESVAVTGTAGSNGALESEITDGGQTVVLTLTNTKWQSTLTTQMKQDIIDGLDAAESETAGWNNQVRDTMGTSSVVRDNATQVTITIAEGDVSGYRIADDEVITVTVPASALVYNAALVGPETFGIEAELPLGNMIMFGSNF